jgi:hypothetical protein
MGLTTVQALKGVYNVKQIIVVTVSMNVLPWQKTAVPTGSLITAAILQDF